MRIPAASPPVASCAERGPRGEIIPKEPGADGDAEADLDLGALRIEGERLALELAAEAGEVPRGLDAQRAGPREAHLEGAAGMRDARRAAVDRLDAALRMQVQARARARAAGRRDAVPDEQHAVRVPGEAARVAGRAGEPRVAVVPALEREAAGAFAERDVARPPAARDAEGGPELALVLAVELHGVVRARRAREAAALVGLVAEDAGVDHGAPSAERELEGEDVAVGVAREMV